MEMFRVVYSFNLFQTEGSGSEGLTRAELAEKKAKEADGTLADKA